jgi:hypothetical protein
MRNIHTSTCSNSHWEIRHRNRSGCLDAHPFSFLSQAHDVPHSTDVARRLLPDDDEASERYNSGQEAIAAGAIQHSSSHLAASVEKE